MSGHPVSGRATRPAAALLAVAAVAVVACGGAGSTAPGPADGPDSTTPTTEVTPATAVASPTSTLTPTTTAGPEGIGSEELGEGIVLDVSLVADTRPFDPAQDLGFSVVFELDGLDVNAFVDIDYELELGSTTTTGNLSFLVRAGEVSEPHQEVVNRALAADELGAYALRYTGVVEATGGSFTVPFERTVSFVATEDAPAATRSVVAADGALTVEVPRRWNVVSTASAFRAVREDRPDDPPSGLDPADTEVLVDLAGRGLRAVRVSRTLRPLMLDVPEVLIADVPDLFGSGVFSDPEPVDAGGLTGWGIVREGTGFTQRVMVLATRHEVFLVQTTHDHSPSAAQEVDDLLVSLRFDPAEFDRLTHYVNWELADRLDVEQFFRIDVRLPADWRADDEGPLGIAPADGRRGLVRTREELGDDAFEQVVERFVAARVPPDAAMDVVEDVVVDVEMDEVAGLERAVVSVDDGEVGGLVATLLSDGDSVVITSIRDDPDDPDPELLAAIAATISPVGPPAAG